MDLNQLFGTAAPTQKSTFGVDIDKLASDFDLGGAPASEPIQPERLNAQQIASQYWDQKLIGVTDPELRALVRAEGLPLDLTKRMIEEDPTYIPTREEYDAVYSAKDEEDEGIQLRDFAEFGEGLAQGLTSIFGTFKEAAGEIVDQNVDMAEAIAEGDIDKLTDAFETAVATGIQAATLGATETLEIVRGAGRAIKASYYADAQRAAAGEIEADDIGSALTAGTAAGSAIKGLAHLNLIPGGAEGAAASLREKKRQTNYENFLAERRTALAYSEQGLLPTFLGEEMDAKALPATSELVGEFLEPDTYLPIMKIGGRLAKTTASKAVDKAARSGLERSAAAAASGAKWVEGKLTAPLRMVRDNPVAQAAAAGGTAIGVAMGAGGSMAMFGSLYSGTLGATSLGSKLADVTHAIARASARKTKGAQWSVMENLAADPTLPTWIRQAASTRLAWVGEKAVKASGGVIPGAATSGLIAAVSGAEAQEVGQAAGEGAGLVGGAYPVLRLATTAQRREFERQQDMLTFYQQLRQQGSDAEGYAALPEATRLQMATMQGVLGPDFRIELLRRPDYLAQGGAGGTAGVFIPVKGANPGDPHRILINLDANRNTGDTFMHEVGHAVWQTASPEGKAEFEAELYAVYGPDGIRAKGEEYARTLLRAKNQDRARRAGLSPDAASIEPSQEEVDSLVAEMSKSENNPLLQEIFAEQFLAESKDVDVRVAIRARGSLLSMFGISIDALGRPTNVEKPLFRESPIGRDKRIAKLIQAQLADVDKFRKGIDTPLDVKDPPATPLDPERLTKVEGFDPYVNQNGELETEYARRNAATGKWELKTAKEIRDADRRRREEARNNYAADTPQGPDFKGLARRTDGSISGSQLPRAFYDSAEWSPNAKDIARVMEAAIVDPEGKTVNIVYQQVGRGKGEEWHTTVRRKQGNLRATRREVKPLAFRLTKEGNILVQAVDVGKIQQRIHQAIETGKLGNLWTTPEEATADMMRLLENWANNRPGETGLGPAAEDKKNTLNRILGAGTLTSQGKNPLRGKRGEPFKKMNEFVQSFRLDRVRVAADSGRGGHFLDYSKYLENFAPETNPFTASSSKATGQVMVSPNIDTSLTPMQAIQQMNSQRMNELDAFAAAAAAILTKNPVDRTIGIGEWDTGGEASIFMELAADNPDAAWELATVMAALTGAYGEQISAAAILPNAPDSNATMYRAVIPGGMKEGLAALRAAGISASTLLPAGDKTVAVILDFDDADNVGHKLKNAGLPFDNTPARAELIWHHPESAQDENAQTYESILTNPSIQRRHPALASQGPGAAGLAGAALARGNANPRSESPRARELRTGAAKPIQAVHYSRRAGLDVLTTESHGGGLPGAERARKSADARLYPGRVYFGDARYNKEAGLGDVRYEFPVEREGLFIRGQEFDDAAQARFDAFVAANPDVSHTTAFEAFLKEEGFTGVYDPESGAGFVFDDIVIAKGVAGSVPTAGVRYQSPAVTALVSPKTPAFKRDVFLREATLGELESIVNPPKDVRERIERLASLDIMAGLRTADVFRSDFTDALKAISTPELQSLYNSYGADERRTGRVRRMAEELGRRERLAAQRVFFSPDDTPTKVAGIRERNDAESARAATLLETGRREAQAVLDNPNSSPIALEQARKKLANIEARETTDRFFQQGNTLKEKVLDEHFGFRRTEYQNYATRAGNDPGVRFGLGTVIGWDLMSQSVKAGGAQLDFVPKARPTQIGADLSTNETSPAKIMAAIDAIHERQTRNPYGDPYPVRPFDVVVPGQGTFKSDDLALYPALKARELAMLDSGTSNYQEILIQPSFADVGSDFRPTIEPTHWKSHVTPIASIRVSSLGDALVLDEIQSDWGQAVRAEKAAAASMPFSTTDQWAGLGFRRALVEAVNRGHSKILLPQGSTVAIRFGGDPSGHQVFYDQMVPTLALRTLRALDPNGYPRDSKFPATTVFARINDTVKNPPPAPEADYGYWEIPITEKAAEALQNGGVAYYSPDDVHPLLKMRNAPTEQWRIDKANSRPAPNSPEFKRWFGDSKVTLEDGKTPRVLFHGSHRGFRSFLRPSQMEKELTPGVADAIFFSASPVEASLFATLFPDKPADYVGNLHGQTYPVYLSLQNPFEFWNPEHRGMVVDWVRKHVGEDTAEGYRDLDELISRGDWTTIEEETYQEAIQSIGFDGFTVTEKSGSLFTPGRMADVNYAVWDPRKIKSAIGNNGNWDPRVADIAYSPDEGAFSTPFVVGDPSRNSWGHEVRKFYDSFRELARAAGMDVSNIDPVNVQFAGEEETVSVDVAEQRVRDMLLAQGKTPEQIARIAEIPHLAPGLRRRLANVNFSPDFRDLTREHPVIRQAGLALKEGNITAKEYDTLVNLVAPLRPFERPLAPASMDEVRSALTSDKQPFVGAVEKLEPGTPVGLRLDIPAYTNHGTWVVSVHEPRGDLERGLAGPRIGYTNSVRATDVRFGINEQAALFIAGGKRKTTIATMEGNFEESGIEAPEDWRAWTQIGMNPMRHSFFFDRETGEPVLYAGEVIQVGGMVLAKDVEYGNARDFLFSPDLWREDKEMLNSRLQEFVAEKIPAGKMLPVKQVQGMIANSDIKPEEVRWADTTQMLRESTNEEGMVDTDVFREKMRLGGFYQFGVAISGQGVPGAVRYNVHSVISDDRFSPREFSTEQQADAYRLEWLRHLKGGLMVETAIRRPSEEDTTLVSLVASTSGQDVSRMVIGGFERAGDRGRVKIVNTHASLGDLLGEEFISPLYAESALKSAADEAGITESFRKDALVTLQIQTIVHPVDVEQRARINVRGPNAPGTRYVEHSEEGWESYYEYLLMGPSGYESGHYAEAGDSYIAHMRVTSRENGDLTYIEEVQSDRHSDGSQEGYVPMDTRGFLVKSRQKLLSEMSPERFGGTLSDFRNLMEFAEMGTPENEAKLKGFMREYAAFHDEIVEELGIPEDLFIRVSTRVVGNPGDEYYELRPEDGGVGIAFPTTYDISLEDAAKASRVFNATLVEADVRREGVVDAPYRKSWHMQLFKRALDFAVQQGSTRLGWTAGATQARRYASQIQQAIDSVEWAVSDKQELREGAKIVRLHTNEGATGYSTVAVKVDRNGEIFSLADNYAEPRELIGEPLKRVIGRELAERILGEEKGTIEPAKEEGMFFGHDLYRFLYDSEGTSGGLVKDVTKYLKPYGVVPKRGTLDNESKSPSWFIDIPPQLAKDIKEKGQYLYSPDISIEDVRQEVINRAPDGDTVFDVVRDLDADTLDRLVPPETLWSGVWDGKPSEFDGIVTHRTTGRNVVGIITKGLEPRNETRGIANAGTGLAVFAALGPGSDAYGEFAVQIDLGSAIRDGLPLSRSLEGPIAEAMQREAVLSQLGVDDPGLYTGEYAGYGIYEDTLVLRGATIPPEYLQIENENGDIVHRGAKFDESNRRYFSPDLYPLDQGLDGIREADREAVAEWTLGLTGLDETALPLQLKGAPSKGGFKPKINGSKVEVAWQAYNLLQSAAVAQLGIDPKFLFGRGGLQATLNNMRLGQEPKFASPAHQDAFNRIVEAIALQGVQDIVEKLKDPEVARAQRWYKDVAAIVRDLLPHAPARQMFTEFLGGTSPNTDVETNFLYAADLFNRWRKGELDKNLSTFRLFKTLDSESIRKDISSDDAVERYVANRWTDWLPAGKSPKGRNITSAKAKARAWARKVQATARAGEALTKKQKAANDALWIGANDMEPRRASGGKYGIHGIRVLQILDRSWLESTEAPKAPNFAGNLAGTTSKATIDVWAIRWLARMANERFTAEPWRLLPIAEAGVTNSDFFLGQAVFDRVVAQLKDQYAIDMEAEADDLQAIAWFGEKKEWEARGWSERLDLGDFRRYLDTLTSEGNLLTFEGTEFTSASLDFLRSLGGANLRDVASRNAALANTVERVRARRDALQEAMSNAEKAVADAPTGSAASKKARERVKKIHRQLKDLELYDGAIDLFRGTYSQ